ncbi:MAG TPA: CxxxxCH/CxxCH domain-containing protein, partial [Candidatus Limnocylindrales bacterium]|nr:CxxxxCH/CxxCH domain-containing protein [Candidatus Limnocylindrales bacterium]
MFAAASGETIRVSTNRYSVFAPFGTVDQINYDADNSSFTFAVGALLIGANGTPLANTNVTYYIYSGNGALKKSGNITTKSNGIAIVTYNTFKDFTTSTDTDYGVWTVKAALASNTNINSTANMNINITGRNGCNKDLCHNNPADNGGAGTSPKSPYSDNSGIASTTSMAYGAHITKGGTHGIASSDACQVCHIGLDRDPGSSTINAPSGVHKNIDCITCHQNPTTWPITIPSCYSPGCHPRSNNNLTNISTLATINGITNVSIYSTTSNVTVIPYSLHNGSQYGNATGVPCWICHGPEHNITKPDPFPANTNNITEYTQCTACHNSYKRHNDSVSCTVCHSQDAHDIKVFAQNATYIDDAKSAARGNCTNCHQNSSFLGALLSKPRAGSYSGSAPQVQVPLNHSNDPLAGKKWNATPGYWTNGTSGSAQYTACKYCHGNTTHNSSALGRPLFFDGDNVVGSTISSSTNWCASCHWQNYSSGGNNYNDMVRTFKNASLPVPPEITGNATYGANKSNPAYFNHSNISVFGDSNCKSCHGSLTASSNITGLMHNAATGAATDLDNCMNCHNTDQGIYPAIVESSFGKHKDVNTTGGNNNLTNNDCKTCHYNVTNMNDPGFTTPTKACADCHTTGNYSARIISNHKPGGVNISTAAYCSSCHNNSISMFAYNTNASVGHYTTNTSLVDTANCITCHKNTTNATKWGNATDPWNSPTFPHSINNTPKEDCYACHNNVSATNFHNVTLIKPTISTVNCIDCHTTNKTMAPKEVDAGVFNTGVHKNRACENCHANATDTNMNGTYLFSSDAAKPCTYCHTGPGNFSAPLVGEHTHVGKEVITTNATCNTCHDNSGMYLPNTGTNGSSTAISHYVKDITNRSSTPYLHNGPINTSNCIECHNNATYSNNASWGSPVNISTSSKRVHTETQTIQCDICHKDSNISSLGIVDFHNASIQKSAGCISCHSQPPSGTIRYNMTGAHDLHKTKGYGSVPETSCDYCHSTGGRNEGGHPNTNDNATVVTNGSASIDTYVMNPASGKDDTCSGVSCHSNGLSPGARVGTATWDSTTAGACNECHSTVTSGLPPTGNHTKHYTTKGYSCAECHGTNADAGTQAGHKTNSQIDINFTNLSFGGSINASKECSVYCHSPNANDVRPKPAWNASSVVCGDCHSLPPTTTRNNVPHTTDTNCADCHGAGAENGTQAGHIDGTITATLTCVTCHNTVTSSDLGLHSDFNGTSVVDNGDCTTCHFASFPMVKGAVNNSNTYFCADCHTTAGTGPNKSTPGRTFTEKEHGQNACMDCHAADGIYHQDNPRGSVANATYVSRYNSSNTLTTDCADCHYAKNLDDAPFNAPGGGSHINNLGGSCSTGGGSLCHAGGSTLVQTIHSLSGKSQGNRPTVTVPSLSSSNVTKGSEVTVNTTVSIASLYELVDGAQYRIMSGTTEIQSWTQMSAVGGNFGGSSTGATAMISTNLLNAGTYRVEVRGMAGGPAQNPAIRYYPINGNVSTTQTANLTVLSPM